MQSENVKYLLPVLTFSIPNPFCNEEKATQMYNEEERDNENSADQMQGGVITAMPAHHPPIVVREPDIQGAAIVHFESATRCVNHLHQHNNHGENK